jgi:hypothetical protein
LKIQRRPPTNVGYLRTGVSGKGLYTEGNPINSSPGRQENPLASISTSSNDAGQLSISLFHRHTCYTGRYFEKL